MEGWWDELDREILEHVTAAGTATPEVLATKLGMSPQAVCSCLAMLATDGKLRITSVGANRPSFTRAA
jgi:DNA-binding Lrp family transcriptional regulator